MSDTHVQIEISLAEKYEKDPLVECIMFLRTLAKTYPRHLSLAYRALENEAGETLPSHNGSKLEGSDDVQNHA